MSFVITFFSLGGFACHLPGISKQLPQKAPAAHASPTQSDKVSYFRTV
jgi:hypothetical protein